MRSFTFIKKNMIYLTKSVLVISVIVLIISITESIKRQAKMCLLRSIFNCSRRLMMLKVPLPLFGSFSLSLLLYLYSTYFNVFLAHLSLQWCRLIMISFILSRVSQRRSRINVIWSWKAFWSSHEENTSVPFKTERVQKRCEYDCP